MPSNDILVKIGGTSSTYQAAARGAELATGRLEKALLLSVKAQDQLNLAVKQYGVGSKEAAAADATRIAALDRVVAAKQAQAIADKRATEAMVRDEAAVAAATEAAATKRAAALKKVGSVGGAVGAAAAIGLGLAAKAAADFNAKMALVATLSHASAADVAKLAAATKDYANIGYSASDAADAEAELVKAGISVKDIMGGGLKASLTLAAAGQMDVASATSIAAQAMVQFQLKGKDLPHIADLLAAGADKALGSAQDLGDGLSYAGLAAHQLGVPIEQAIATLAEFAQAGLIGQKGGTAFQQMLLKLENPSAKAAAELKTLGINLYNAQGSFVGMANLAGQLHDKLSGVDEATRNAALSTIFGQRAIRGAMILYQGGASDVENWTRKIDDSGFAMQQATGKLNSLSGDWAKFKAQLFNTGADLGQELQPALRGVTQDATGILDVVDKIPGPVKSVAVEFGLLIAALGAGLWAFTRAKAAIASLGEQLMVLRGQEVAAAGGTTGIAGAVGALGGRRLALQGGALLAGVGAQVGSQYLPQGSAAQGALGVVSGAVSGAAIGSFFPGPGTVIGAGIGTAVGALQAYTQQSQAAAAAQKSLDAAAASVASTLDKSTGAITSATAAQAKQSLTSQGAYGYADDLGLSYDKVTKAALGLVPVQSVLSHATGGNATAFLKLYGILNETSSRVDAHRKAIIRAGDAQVVAGQSVQRMGSAVDEEGHSFRGSVGPVLTAKQALDKYSGATVQALNATIKLDNAALGKKGDWANYRQSILSVNEGLKQNGKTLDVNTTKGYANFQNLQNQAQMAQQYASHLRVGSDAWVTFMTKARAALLDSAKNLGYSNGKARAYVNTVLGIPTDWKTQADFDNVLALQKIRQTQYALQQIKDKTIHINVVAGVASGVGQIRGYASGTSGAPPGYALVGEGGPELVRFRGGERVYPAQQTAAMLHRLPAFANGTMGARSSVVVQSDPALLQRLTQIEARLGTGIPVTEQHPENFGRPMRDIAAGAVNARADFDARLATVDGGGN